MLNKSVNQFKQTYNEYINPKLKLGKLVEVLENIENNNFSSLQAMETEEKLWKELVRALAFKNSKECFGKYIPIQKVY
jgi:hypothetical protein